MSSSTIAGLAREGGVNVETIRYYQRRGLMSMPARPRGSGPSGGVRRYGLADLERLHFIRAAQSAGFTLEQIKELLTLDAGADRARIRLLARERIADLDARIVELKTARDALARLTEECGSACGREPCPIMNAFRQH
jgi:MerR family transcriptional regulator, mercuric resistance operon regulatory protein